MNQITLKRRNAIKKLKSFLEKFKERDFTKEFYMVRSYAELYKWETVGHLENIIRMLELSDEKMVTFHESRLTAETDVKGINTINIYFPRGDKFWDEFVQTD